MRRAVKVPVRFALVVAGVLAGVGCGGSDPGGSDPVEQGLSTDTTSASISGESEQIEFLERYVVLPSPIEETEFHIVYRDNSGGAVPGPSDWTIEFAVRVDPGEMSLWTEGVEPIDAPPAWDDELITGWDVGDASPRFYGRSGTVRAVYGDEVVLQVSSTT